MRNYGKDPRVTLLLDRTEIHLLPSLNPDGFDKSWEGCDIIVRLFRSGKAMTNANGRDLNKDYPKHFHQNQDAPMKNLAIGRQPETVAMMKWLRSEPFVLSANLRGGDVAAVYPYVDSPWSPDLTKGQYSKAPDDAFLKFVAGLYSANHATMHRGDNCGGDKVLDQGIVNGAVWSNTPGTLTDYTYIYTNAMALSLQLSCCKHPASRDLYSEWRANKESLLKFVESAHMGLKGLVLDSSYMPIMVTIHTSVFGINLEKKMCGVVRSFSRMRSLS